MKKIVLTVFAAAALAACSTPDIPVSDPHAISFGNVGTRAGLTDLQKDGFGVWACINGPQGYVPLLSNEHVTKSGDNWTYTNTRYWVDDSKFYFLAVHPYSADNSPVEEHRITDEGSNRTGYTMTVTTPAAANYDPLMATNVTDTSNAGYSTIVPLNFEHMMCKVNLKVEQDFEKSPDFDYYVSKVTISGIKNSGTFMAMPYGNIFYRGWNFEGATTTTFEKSFTAPVRLRNPDAADKKIVLTVFGEGLLLIPQEITTNAVRVLVDYYYDVDPSDDDMGVAKSVETFIPATNIWESNKAITYTLPIADSNDIKFLAPTIESWGSPQTGGTIIIK